MDMCAIAGVIGCPLSDAAVEKMLETMARRGPDGIGVYREAEVNLLHTRLAIVDPAGGSQPMELSWRGEDYVLIYNGELYNTQELRHTLTAAGHRFAGHSDTEVLLHAYAQFGEGCVHRLNGIYAFAVWEKKRKRLFLCRDRIGVKPLFYALKDGCLMFASEMKTLFAAGHPRQLEKEGLWQLVLMGPGRAPGSGVFRNILELEPGCCGFCEAGDLRVTRYWKLRDREHRENFEETAECVRYLVTDAIRRQMVSDVPIGTFLSGGLDSSIITAVCAEALEQEGTRLPTFSVDYEGNDRYFTANDFQPDSDGEYIRLMADAFHTDHHFTCLDPEDLIGVLEAATVARDLPGMADVDFSLLVFCARIRPHVKVALSGECADEIFGGYPWYRDPGIRSQEGFPWARNIEQRSALLHKADGGVDYVQAIYRKTCLESDILPGRSADERRMKEMVNLNFRHFMQTLLDRKDRMSMYNSLEVRVPFCDYRIAEYLYGVPWEFKDHGGREKGLLRYAVAGLLPDRICTRKKSPYPKTFDPSYETAVLRKLYQRMEEPSPLWELVGKAQLRAFLENDQQWPWYGQLMRRPQTAAYFLQLDFWLKYYSVDFCF